MLHRCEKKPETSQRKIVPRNFSRTGHISPGTKRRCTACLHLKADVEARKKFPARQQTTHATIRKKQSTKVQAKQRSADGAKQTDALRLDVWRRKSAKTAGKKKKKKKRVPQSHNGSTATAWTKRGSTPLSRGLSLPTQLIQQQLAEHDREQWWADWRHRYSSKHGRTKHRHNACERGSASLAGAKLAGICSRRAKPTGRGKERNERTSEQAKK